MQKKQIQAEILKKIQDDMDFIISVKYNNSLNSFLAKNPNGTDNGTIAKFLGLDSPEETEQIYGISIEKLRKLLNV